MSLPTDANPTPSFTIQRGGGGGEATEEGEVTRGGSGRASREKGCTRPMRGRSSRMTTGGVHPLHVNGTGQKRLTNDKIEQNHQTKSSNETDIKPSSEDDDDVVDDK